MRRILRNRIQCVLCNDIIESTHRHDFRGCKCGEVFIDGGLDYVRIGWKTHFPIEMTEYDETEEDPSPEVREGGLPETPTVSRKRTQHETME